MLAAAAAEWLAMAATGPPAEGEQAVRAGVDPERMVAVRPVERVELLVHPVAPEPMAS
jgi:hypothetical protein